MLSGIRSASAAKLGAANVELASVLERVPGSRTATIHCGHAPEALLPLELREDNPLRLPRRVDGR